MTAIVRKELRELGLVLIAASAFMALAGLALFDDAFVANEYLMTCGAVGLAVGAWQSVLDRRFERDEFTRHRSLGRTALRVSRALAGALVCAWSACVPWAAFLLLPGKTGCDVYVTGPRHLLTPVPDLERWHVLVGVGFALTFWSLVRFGASLPRRRVALAPVVAAALAALGLLALQARPPSLDVVLVVLVPLVATSCVVLPVRDFARGDRRRILPLAAALLLVAIAAPWLDALSWGRVLVRERLRFAYPRLAVDDDDVVHYRRTTYRWSDAGEIATRRVQTWDVETRRVLTDESSSTSNDSLPAYERSTRHVHVLGRQPWHGAFWPHRSRVYTDGRGPVRSPTTPLDRVGANLFNLRDDSGSLLLVRCVDGRLSLHAIGRAAEPRAAFGSIGPDGFSADDSATTRFPSDAVRLGTANVVSRAPGQIAILVPSSRRIHWVRLRDSAVAGQPWADVVTIPVPPGPDLTEPGATALFTTSPHGSRTLTTAIALRTDGGVLVRRADRGPWRLYPLDEQEQRGGVARFPTAIDRPVYGEALPPHVDGEDLVRVRVMPLGATEFVVTDVRRRPHTAAERTWERAFGVLSCFRPPALNAASFASPPPRTRGDLIARWLRSGFVAGGRHAGWLLASLLVGGLCAGLAARRARTRCASRGAVRAWAAAAFLLGPLGLLWMRLVVPARAVRETLEGHRRAVDLPGPWPEPSATGWEVWTDGEPGTTVETPTRARTG